MARRAYREVGQRASAHGRTHMSAENSTASSGILIGCGGGGTKNSPPDTKHQHVYDTDQSGESPDRN
jgi:hypothetical protein